MDIVGEKFVPSLTFRGDVATGKYGGGNSYAVIYVDEATERGFVDFIRTKDELEASVLRMTAHMEIEAQKSVDFKAGAQIRVGTFVSDRDSNMTSAKAVAQSLGRRIGQQLTARDRKNQTPRLDGYIRRVLDLTRTNLDQSGLSKPFWEFAMRDAVHMLELYPTSGHRAHHSALKRWHGRDLPLERRLKFGADVYPVLPVSERQEESKLDAMAPGGEGRYRLMGIEQSYGLEGMGYRVLDVLSKPPQMYVVGDLEVDEDLERVRLLPLPKEVWPNARLELLESEGFKDLDGTTGEGGETVDVLSEPAGEEEAPAEEGDGDLEPGGAEPEEELEAQEEKDEGAPDDGGVGSEECEEQEQLEAERERRAQAIAYEWSKRQSGVNWKALPDDTRIAFRQANPKRPGSDSYDRYEVYKRAKTLGQFYELRRSRSAADLKWDANPVRAKGNADKLPNLLVGEGAAEPPEAFRRRMDAAWSELSAHVAADELIVIAGDGALPAAFSAEAAEAELSREEELVGLLVEAKIVELERRQEFEVWLADIRARLTENGNGDDGDNGAGRGRPKTKTERKAALKALKARKQRREKESRAEKRYSAATAVLHHRLDQKGIKVPAEVHGADRALPYWEAATAQEPQLQGVLEHTWAQAAEFASALIAISQGDAGAVEYARQLQADAAEMFHEGRREFDVACGVRPEFSDVRAADVPTPRNYKEAIEGEFRALWLDAIEAEIQNLIEHGCFEWVHPPPGAHKIRGTWAWKVKARDDGLINKAKARCVAQGFRQIYGTDYLDSSAPVGKLTTMRVLLAEAAHMNRDWATADVRSAYLEAPMDIVQFMIPPPGVPPPEPGMVMKLVKGLYGTVQGGRLWHRKFRGDLLRWGFVASAADSCLFTKRDSEGRFIRILLFVDDLAIFTSRDAAGEAMKKELLDNIAEQYKFSTNEGVDDVYIGLKITRVGKNGIFLSNLRYTLEACIKHGYIGVDGELLKARTFTTAPSRAGPILKSDCPPGDPSENPLGSKYRQLCGVLRWMEQTVRPDISATLSELCKVQSNPGQIHMDRLDHLMRYVASTKEKGIMYGSERDASRPDGPIVMYTDSDWGGDKETAESRGGFVALSWQSPVSWSSFKIKSIAASSSEAEYMAAFHASREAKWLRYLYSDMGYGDLSPTHFGNLDGRDYERERLPDLVDRTEVPILVACDNKSAISISKNPVLHNRSKHIHIKYQWVRIEVNKGHVRLKYVNTKENLADTMTKLLPKVTHDLLVSQLMMGMRDGAVETWKGDVLVGWKPREPRTPQELNLYAVEPPGMSCEDLLLPEARLKGGLPDREARLEDGSASCVNEHVRDAVWMASAMLDSGVLDKVSDACASEMVDALVAEVYAGYSNVALSLYRAIVDSGASHTYVGKNVRLQDALPGKGVVWVANGKSENIVEEGRLGPLLNAKKVMSFSRSLISVRDLVDQYGGVWFDADGVHVVTLRGGESGVADLVGGRNATVTKIGMPTSARLYSFDIEQLEAHHRDVDIDACAVRAAVQRNADIAMGAR